MLKKIINKRVELFKTKYPNYETSKKGNLYYRLNPTTVKHNLYHTGFGITKGQMKKIGVEETYTKNTEDAVFLIVPETGKFLVKHNTNRHGTKNFKRVTLKDVTRLPILAEPFFVGRKFEYLKDYPKLWCYRLCQNFTSLKELKIFLGYEFISNKKFYSIFEEPEQFDYILYLYKADNKTNLVNLFTNNTGKHYEIFKLFFDILDLTKFLNVKFDVPAGLNKLKEIHDELTDAMNTQKLSVCSKEVDYKLEPIADGNKMFFLDYWDTLGIPYRKLETEYQMLEQGIKQHHCLGAKDLKDNSFFSFTYEGKDYDIMIHPQAGLCTQFNGKYNIHPPLELRQLVMNHDINYRHKIIPLHSEEVMNYKMEKFSLAFEDDFLPF